jgi:hypothetical protein
MKHRPNPSRILHNPSPVCEGFEPLGGPFSAIVASMGESFTNPSRAGVKDLKQQKRLIYKEKNTLSPSIDKSFTPTRAQRQYSPARTREGCVKDCVKDSVGMAVAMGDPGCLSLFGRDEKAHRMLADHLTAEYRVKATAQGRTVDEWKLRATRPDNHWLDCLVGCAVAASIQGASLASVESGNARSRPRLKLSALQGSR